MATPTVALLRRGLGPGAVIVGQCRPGMDELLAGFDELDDVVVADARKLMGPAKVASRLMGFHFGAALLLPNSFSSAMTVRLAGIPLRVGYDRDGRGLLLTHRLEATRRGHGRNGWEPISAVEYYLRAGRAMLEALNRPAEARWPAPPLRLAMTPTQEAAAAELLAAAGIAPGQGYAVLNPGGNNPAKRWPIERFAAVADHLITRHGLTVLINGSPGERDLTQLIKHAVILADPGRDGRVICLPELGVTIGALKGVVRGARLVVTNDTGPRHIAAAFGVRCVTLFGPTDPRWTTLPEQPGVLREAVLVADPTLPADEVADDHPERCRIDRIAVGSVVEAVERVLAG